MNEAIETLEFALAAACALIALTLTAWVILLVLNLIKGQWREFREP